MEDNTGCYYRYHTKDLGLNDAFLKCLLACQVDIITASDAHYPRHVGAYLREAEAKIRCLVMISHREIFWRKKKWAALLIIKLF